MIIKGAVERPADIVKVADTSATDIFRIVRLNLDVRSDLRLT